MADASRQTVKATILIGVGALALDILFYSVIGSGYALGKLWVPSDLKAVELVGILLLAGGTSLVMGYVSRAAWPGLIPHVIALTAPQLLMGLPLLQGFALPTGLMAALMFGWIGSRLPRPPRE